MNDRAFEQEWLKILPYIERGKEAKCAEALRSILQSNSRRFPMKEGITIDYESAKHIYAMYSKLFSGQTFEDIERRGGFGWVEAATIIKEYEKRFGAYKAV